MPESKHCMNPASADVTKASDRDDILAVGAECVRSAPVRRVIIDNNGVDPFVDLHGAYEAARAATKTGDLEIRYVHGTLTEAASTPDLDRRTRKLLVLALGEPIVSSGFVFNETRFDQATFSDEAGAADIEGLTSGNLDHENNRRDALAAATALGNGCALVTHDSRLTRRAQERGIEVLSTADLLREIGFPAA
jgi:hypothetical protein